MNAYSYGMLMLLAELPLWSQGSLSLYDNMGKHQTWIANGIKYAFILVQEYLEIHEYEVISKKFKENTYCGRLRHTTLKFKSCLGTLHLVR